MSSQDKTSPEWWHFDLMLMEMKKSKSSSTFSTMTSSHVSSLSFPHYLANEPATWTDHPHANVRCCCFGQLFSRSPVREGCCAARHRANAEWANRAIKLSSSICGFLRPNRPNFAIRCARYFCHSYISRAMIQFDVEHEVY